MLVMTLCSIQFLPIIISIYEPMLTAMDEKNQLNFSIRAQHLVLILLKHAAK